MFNSAKEIAELKAKIEGLETSFSAEALAKAALESQLTEANASLVEKGIEVTDLTAKLTKAEADHTAAIEALKAEHASAIEQKVTAEVITRCAAAGVEPIATTANVSAEGETTAANLTGLAKARALLAAKNAK